MKVKLNGRVAILIFDKMKFKPKSITGDKEGD